MADINNTLTVRLKLDNSELIQQLEALLKSARPLVPNPDTSVLSRRLENAERLLLRVHRLVNEPNPIPLRRGGILARDIDRYVSTIKADTE